VDAVAELFGVKVYETPVGFKYIGALMESEPIIVGGEGIRRLERQGPRAGKGRHSRLPVDGRAGCHRKEIVGTNFEGTIQKRSAIFNTDRINIGFAPEKKDALLAKLGGGLQNVGPFKVEKFITTDGYKFLLPNHEWVAFRASGTEPLIAATSRRNQRQI